ncbi:MAG: hypothetical protein AAGF19_04675, partial [Pseudomonadota bacterium]
MELAQLIVLLPLVGALLAVPVGLGFGPRASEVLTTALLLICAGLSAYVFYDVALSHGGGGTVPLMTWIQSGTLDVKWALRVDSLSAVMLVVITGVSSLVHLYSIGYMHEDPDRPRFFAYLVVTGGDNEPWGIRTALGWGVVGLVQPTAGDATSCYATSGTLASKQCHFALKTQVREVKPSYLIDMLNAEFQDTLVNAKTSQDDARFVNLMESEMHVTEDGHMEAPLPLRNPNVAIPNKKQQALKRLNALKKRLQRDPS